MQDGGLDRYRDPNTTRTYTFVDRVVDSLGRDILRQVYPSNSHLPVESIIASEHGVSRNVVREAVKILSAKNLVRTERGSGTLVLPTSDWNWLDVDFMRWALDIPEMAGAMVDELNALRAAVEPMVAAEAARHATRIEVLRLFEAYERMETATSKAESVEADILFHQRMFEASHNRLLLSLIQNVAVLLRANFAQAIHVDLERARYPDDHLLVAEAIQAKEPDAAAAAMRRLLEENIESLSLVRANG